ncbi:hypothetical protein AGMMS4956_18660 [Bacteroidia bacterium]|nr:hypothetical protein AGMMS4956_18660 [Bacteroidia bacterium]
MQEEEEPEELAEVSNLLSSSSAKEDKTKKDLTKATKKEKAPSAKAGSGRSTESAGRVYTQTQTLQFSLGSTQLWSGSMQIINKAAAFVAQHPEATVVVAGHTCTRGNSATNMQLSQRRADIVAAYLQQRGVSKNKIDIRYYGASNPIAPNDTEKNSAKNRRVTIEINYKK